jgi:hypothetical protein
MRGEEIQEKEVEIQILKGRRVKNGGEGTVIT